MDKSYKTHAIEFWFGISGGPKGKIALTIQEWMTMDVRNSHDRRTEL
jgi:hypothetical protein